MSGSSVMVTLNALRAGLGKEQDCDIEDSSNSQFRKSEMQARNLIDPVFRASREAA